MGPKAKRTAQPTLAAAAASNGSASAAANRAVANGPAAAGRAAALKEAESLFKKFKQKSDAKMLPRLRTAVTDAASAAGFIMLAKALVLLALETSLRKCSPPPVDPAARMAETGSQQRMQAEDALEAEVVGLLMEALEQAAAGINAEGKRKSLRCLSMAAQLLGMMRGRGVAEQVARRLELGEKLAGQARVMFQLELQASQRGAAGIPWLPASAEGPPPRWPFEAEDGPGPAEKLKQACMLLAQAKEMDERARQGGEAVFSLPCELLRAPEECARRVQERLTSWPLLPREARILLARRYQHTRVGGELEAEGVRVLHAGGGRDPTAGARTASRQEKQRVGATEAKAEQLSKAAEKVAAERQKKAEAVATAAEAAAQRQTARAELLGQQLAKRVAAAGDSREAQLAALVGSLRLSVDDMRQQAQRLGREEWSEAEAARVRAALDRLPSNQQWMFCWGGEAAAALASQSAGSAGAAAASGAKATFIADATPERVEKRLAEAMACRSEDVRGLVAPPNSSPEALSWLHRRFKVPANLSLSTAPDMRSPEGALPEEVVPAHQLDPFPQDLGVAAGLAGDAASRRAALASVYLEAADIHTIRGQVQAVEAAQEHAAAPENQADTVPAAAAAHREPAYEGGVPPNLRQVNPLADFLCLSWGDVTGVVGKLIAAETSQYERLPPMSMPYSFTADIVNLFYAMLQGQRVMELLEARQQGKEPDGWGWWDRKVLGLATRNAYLSDDPDPVRFLACIQPDQRKLCDAAEALDAFNRWYLGAHRRYDAHVFGQQPATAGAAAAASQQATPEHGPSEGLPTCAADAATVLVAEQPQAGAAGANATAAGRDAEEELELYSGPAEMTEVLVDWVLRGLAAASLAQVAVPPDVAAAAVPAGQADSGSADPLAAWVRQHKEAVSRRVLLALTAMHREGVLSLQLINCVGSFVVAQPGAYDLTYSQAAQRRLQEAGLAGVTSSPEAAAAQLAVLLDMWHEVQSAGADAPAADGTAAHGTDPPVVGAELISTYAALALLPLIPLSSLHQLLAFVFIQLGWYADSMQSVQEALKPGDEGLLAVLMDLQPSSGKGGGRQAALTTAGLEWLLLSHTHPQAPFPVQHFQDDEASPADMAAQLAALTRPLAEQGCAPASDCPAAEQDAAAAGEPAASTGGGASCSVADPGGSSTEDAPAPSHQPGSDGSGAAEDAPPTPTPALPPYLRLGPAAADFQPPSELRERLRLLISYRGPGSAGVLRSNDAATFASSGTEARAALLYLHITTQAVDFATQVLTEVHESTLAPDCLALKDWLALEPAPSRGPQLPSRLAQDEEKRLDAAACLVQAATTAEYVSSLVQLTHAALRCRGLATSVAAAEGVHLPAARRALEQAVTEEQREEAEALVLANQEHLDTLRQLLGQADNLLREHRTLELCWAQKRATPAMIPRATSLFNALTAVEQARHRAMAGLLSDTDREQAEQAAADALRLIEDIENEVLQHLDTAESYIPWLNSCSTGLSFKLQAATASMLASCRVHVPWLAARMLVRDLLPAAWEVEQSAVKAADDARALMLEEEKERERQRQLEAERREAERKARAKRAEKAAAAVGVLGGGGKGATRADWRGELEDVAAGEANGAQRSEEDDEARPLSKEQAANLARLWEEAGSDDEHEWQQAGAAGRQQQQQERQERRRQQQRERQQRERQQQQRQQQQQQQQQNNAVLPQTRPRPSSSPAVLAVSRASGTLAAVPHGQQPQMDSAVAASQGGAGDVGMGGWSFEHGGWEEQAAQEGADDVDALLANMNIHSGSPPLLAETEDDDDPDLAAAIAASLAHANGALPPAPAPGSYAAAAGGHAAAIAAGSPGAGAGSPGPHEPGLAGAVGLRNEAGEYNCFLNVIVQCLWQCAEFRRQVASWGPGITGSDPVLSALHGLFQAFQQQSEEEEEERGRAAGTVNTASSSAASSAAGSAPPSPAQPARAWGTPRSPGKPPASPGGRERTVVDPTPLRQALAALPGRSFEQGEMHDPAEVLLCVYEKIIHVQEEQRSCQPEAACAPAALPTDLQRTFGLAVREEVHCAACGTATHQAAYEQFFYTTQATGLRYLFESSPGSSTGRLLRELEAQHQKSCDEDVGGCGRPNSVNHFLERAPRVFTLQLTWESHSEQPADIAATLAAIDEEVDLGELYQGAERGAHRYRLRSMVCYYGQHYQALVLVPEAGGWLVFDDTRVARVGSWEAVRRKCEAGRIQPSVLFYAAA